MLEGSPTIRRHVDEAKAALRRLLVPSTIRRRRAGSELHVTARAVSGVARRVVANKSEQGVKLSFANARAERAAWLQKNKWAYFYIVRGWTEWPQLQRDLFG